MSAHNEGRAEAARVVLEHWKNVAQKAREAGLTELAAQADAQIALLERPKPADA